MKFESNKLLGEIERLSKGLEEQNIIRRVEDTVAEDNFNSPETEFEVLDLKRKIEREREDSEALEQ